MKKVVLKQTEEVSIDSITNESIVGVMWKYGVKGYVINVGGSFCSVTPFDTKGEKWIKSSQKEYAERVLSEWGGGQVFLFDTEEEIVDWLKS